MRIGERELPRNARRTVNREECVPMGHVKSLSASLWTDFFTGK
jgi:hypothetical protein